MFDLTQLKTRSRDDIINEMKESADGIGFPAEKVDRGGGVGIYTKLLSPVDVYTYLKARFGPPNGLMSMMKQSGSDNLIHWDYDLSHERGSIRFIGFLTSIHVMVQDTSRWTNQDWIEFAKTIKSDFRTYGKQKSEVMRSLERWRLFVNPYRRLTNAIEQLSADISELSDSLLIRPNVGRPLASEEMDGWERRLEEASKAQAQLV